MIDHNLARALDAQRAKILNAGTSDGASKGWKSRLMSIHADHFGGGRQDDESGYSSNGKWVSPSKTWEAMGSAYEGDSLDSLAKRYLGHDNMASALKDESGAYDSNRKWLSVAKHAKAIKDASEVED